MGTVLGRPPDGVVAVVAPLRCGWTLQAALGPQAVFQVFASTAALSAGFCPLVPRPTPEEEPSARRHAVHSDACAAPDDESTAGTGTTAVAGAPHEVARR